MKSYFVVCEGLDSSGKTTSIKHTLKYFQEEDFLYSKGLKTGTIAGKFSRRYPSTLSLLTELFYLDKTFVKPNLKKGKNIIQDRWYHSILSHNPVNKKDKILERMFVPYLSEPDLLVYFTVSLDERIKRLEEAENTKDHRVLIERPELIKQKEERFLKYYNDFSGEKFIIDTTDSSEEKSGYRLYKIIEQIRNL